MPSGMPMNCVTLILDGTREFVLRYGYFRPGFSAAGLQRGPNLAPIVPTLQLGNKPLLRCVFLLGGAHSGAIGWLRAQCGPDP